MGLDKRHYYGKALTLIKAIEDIIGFDKKTKLVLDGSREGIFLDSFENFSLAICYILSGRKEEAKQILIGVIKHIGFDPKTGLVHNKKGLSQDESKKVLPGEKTIYLSNQALISILYWLLDEKEKSKEFEEKIDKIIGTFEFKVNKNIYKVYKHGPDQKYFYPFNNILVAIVKLLHNKKNEAQKLIKDTLKICFDKNVGLLKATPKEKIYFLLDNTLLATYYAISRNIKKAEEIIKIIENKIGFDKETKLAYRGTRENKVIKDYLTYNNSHLAITYLCLAGMF